MKKLKNSFFAQKKERIQQLDSFYKKKFEHLTDKRSKSRQRVYDDVSNIEINADDDFYLLAANVGSGKSYAGLKFALRLAEHFDCRRIFTFAPFTNIIDQLANVYNECLILPDEKQSPNFDDSQVVAKHHHLTSYGKKHYNSRRTQLLKSLAVNWFSPITVSSVEQFIDSFASNIVPLIKKLNKVPGSVIIIEEVHTIPVEVWPWFLYILRQLVKKWGCKVLFVSGTPIEFWKFNFVNEAFDKCKVRNIIHPDTARSLSMKERERVKFRLYNNGDYSPINPFVNTICSKAGAKLVVCSTTRNAAVLAQLCANVVGRENVYHVSTALTPYDREKIIKKIMERLKEENRNFIVVGTSCIESGIDLSFDVGFVEARSVSSTMQVAGRINRNFEYNNAELFVFRLFDEGVLTRLSSMNPHENVLIEIMRKNPQLTKKSATESVKIALRMKSNKIEEKGKIVVASEKKFGLRDVRQNVRCINEFGIGAIANPKLLELLNNEDPLCRYEANGEPSSSLTTAWELGLDTRKYVTISWLRHQIQKHSFKISVAKESDLVKKDLPCLNLEDFWAEQNNEEYKEEKPIDSLSDGLFAWQGHYDPDFLGYMNHVLLQLGIPGVQVAPIPFDYVKDMFLK